MLPPVAAFDSAIVAVPSPVEPADECDGLLPSLQSLRSFVATTAREQRQRNLANDAGILQTSPSNSGGEVWGDPKNGRRFERAANGCAVYEFRAGETLRSVVTDLLTEARKHGATTPVDYQHIRQASAQILDYNNLSDPDFIDSGSKLLIPPSLVPSPKRAA